MPESLASRPQCDHLPLDIRGQLPHRARGHRRQPVGDGGTQLPNEPDGLRDASPKGRQRLAQRLAIVLRLHHPQLRIQRDGLALNAPDEGRCLAGQPGTDGPRTDRGLAAPDGTVKL
jgi:hypothetical protein